MKFAHFFLIYFCFIRQFLKRIFLHDETKYTITFQRLVNISVREIKRGFD